MEEIDHPIPIVAAADLSLSVSSSFPVVRQNPGKKRGRGAALGVKGEGVGRKSGASVTGPCTECGKKFWSWKALFGHMRCHPERQWRGINPPPNLRPKRRWLSLTEEDHEVASWLLMLAGSGPCSSSVTQLPPGMGGGNGGGVVGTSPSGGGGGRFFECSSCRKVYSSHHALGGHRASHKNVKGCYAKNHEGR